MWQGGCCFLVGEGPVMAQKEVNGNTYILVNEVHLLPTCLSPLFLKLDLYAVPRYLYTSKSQ